MAEFAAASVWLAVMVIEAASATPETFSVADQVRDVQGGAAVTPPTLTDTVLVFSEQVPLIG